jgi:quercetin dioxygenase-like cupin family protein
VDYAICISGEMRMELEEGSVLLKAGDVVIQRGTNHNWVVHGNQPCVMAYVLIATEGAKTTGWTEQNAKPHK